MRLVACSGGNAEFGVVVDGAGRVLALLVVASQLELASGRGYSKWIDDSWRKWIVASGKGKAFGHWFWFGTIIGLEQLLELLYLTTLYSFLIGIAIRKTVEKLREWTISLGLLPTHWCSSACCWQLAVFAS